MQFKGNRTKQHHDHKQLVSNTVSQFDIVKVSKGCSPVVGKQPVDPLQAGPTVFILLSSSGSMTE